MTAEPTETQTPERPQFRGCVFCYTAEWAYHGARRTVGRLTDD